MASIALFAGCGFDRVDDAAVGIPQDLAGPAGPDLGDGDGAAASVDGAGDCGGCSATDVCVSGPAGASCAPPTIEWALNGSVLQRLGTYEAFYFVGSDALGLYFPYFGRNIQISLANVSTHTAGVFSSCPGGPVSGTTFGVITSDNGWASLDALPPEWKSLNFSSCGTLPSGDVVQTLGLTFSQLTTTHVIGNYDVLVQGAGPRAGSTLRISGSFDLVPARM